MIAVVDYGMGNLRSVSKALEHLGADVNVTAKAAEINDADKLVLPGVGAFKDAADELRQRGLIEPILQHVSDKKPFLGICLGLQLLLSTSEENPGSDGLNLYPGNVQRFKSTGVKIPHMGWNQVTQVGNHPLFKNIPDHSYFYFVHSYYVVPKETELCVGQCDYGQEKFAAIMGRDNVFATQFHPEKSQEAGLQLLKNFVEW